MQGLGGRFSAPALPALRGRHRGASRRCGLRLGRRSPAARRRTSRLSNGRRSRSARSTPRATRCCPGGVPAFERQLRELRGTPVVVNKWASWCGPCRAEFPYFQAEAAERGTEIAFLGVDANDSEDAARTFLEDLPLPYPSFSDPDEEISELLEGAREFPSTAFYDSKGELVYVKRGGYGSRADLAADIDRYAN